MRIIAEITKDFLNRNLNLPEEEIYKTPAVNGGKKFLTVIRRGDSPANYYYFSQRLGINSIRFILYDKSRPKPFCLLEQLEASHNKLKIGAYSGSLDKKGYTPLQVCREEVNEESMFNIEEDDIGRITLVSVRSVGSQSNENAYLYLVDVEGLPEVGTNPENEWEENTNHHWLSLEEVKTKGDWASYIIADSVRVLNTDKTQNGQIIASEGLNSRRRS